jgi:hypothetical protein
VFGSAFCLLAGSSPLFICDAAGSLVPSSPLIHSHPLTTKPLPTSTPMGRKEFRRLVSPGLVSSVPVNDPMEKHNTLHPFTCIPTLLSLARKENLWGGKWRKGMAGDHVFWYTLTLVYSIYSRIYPLSSAVDRRNVVGLKQLHKLPPHASFL